MPKQPRLPSFTFDPTLAIYNVPPPTLRPSHIDRLAVGTLIFSPAPTPKILLLQRASHEKFPLVWEIPGGGVESRDPTILHAAAREAFEETGLMVKHFRRCVDVIEFRGSTGRRWRKFNFEVVVDGGREREVRIDGGEHRDWKWVEREEVVGGMGRGGWSESMLREARDVILKGFEMDVEGV